METDNPSTTEAEQRFEFYSGMPAPDVYFRQISEYELLTHEEEASLGKLVQAGMGAEEARSAELDKEHPDIDRLHKLEYIQQLGGVATEHMVKANLRLVVKIANKVGHSEPVGDAIQDGNVGLLRAVQKFDPAKGYKFSTYASWWIKQAIGRGRPHRSEAPVRLPVHFEAVVFRVRNVVRSIENENSDGAAYDAGAVAEKARVSIYQAQQALDYLRIFGNSVQLDKPLGKNGDQATSVGDVIMDASTEQPDDQVAERLRNEELIRALEVLPERERFVIQSRFGVHDDITHTLEQVGAMLGLTRERIRQIEKNGLGTLRLFLADRKDMIE